MASSSPRPAAPSRPLPIAVSLGDPAGIGPDILLAACAGPAAGSLPDVVLAGDERVLVERAGRLGLAARLAGPDRLRVGERTISLLPERSGLACRAPVVPGKPDAGNARATIAAIERAVALVAEGAAAAVVTGPIAKHVLKQAGFVHPGHTEFLGELAERHWGTRPQPVMMLACDELRVVPVTVHIPLAEVPRRLTSGAIVATARITAQALSRDFGIAVPRLAVAGLNPHAGEAGTMGREEIEVIAPALSVLAGEGLAVTGPHAADTLFHEAARARYDAVIAMYHDQALIPLKTLAFDRGVNVTLGLPFVRTSPDHGTAFDIAGTGRASPASFQAALALAGRLATARASHG